MMTKNKLQKALKLDFKEQGKIWLSEQDSLRILVGILGILLPFLLWFFLYIYSCQYSPLESISHYYYTRVSTLFTGVLILLAVFLLMYKGIEPVDFYFSSAAGLFALCVVLFPTSNISGLTGSSCNDVAVAVLPPSPFREGFHLFSAAIFLSCLAYMSLFLFTKSKHIRKHRSTNKKRRNVIYRFCGIVMVIALLVIVARHFEILIDSDYYDKHHLTFYMETIAVFFFGISWLTKAEVVLKG